MADYERRPRGGGGYNHRKRRYRDEDDYDRRPPRRRYEEPIAVKVRKQLVSIAESPLKRVEDDVSYVAKLICDNQDNEDLRPYIFDLILQLVNEQPLKIPFVAAIVLSINLSSPELVISLLSQTTAVTQQAIGRGDWRSVKLFLKFLACLQGIFEEDGVFSVLEELFSRACDLQTASSEDTLGIELVKIVLLTIPYVVASSSTDAIPKAMDLLDKTDIIASQPHTLEALVNPYPGVTNEQEESVEALSTVGLLQKQLQSEAASGWDLAFLPRPWRLGPTPEHVELLANATKHPLPAITLPDAVAAGPRPLLLDVYFSVYSQQDIETVPPTTSLASCLIRDALVDTINLLDFNRHATARFLIDIDCYFAPETFIKRATPYDRLRNVEGDRSTWKPEDVAVDAVFSQLFQLPLPEHKLIYYHSVLTEACKIAPAAIAPSLGRAIRYLYRNLDVMDLELSYRFMDWFAHHLSNFGFTWKWSEWIDDVELSSLHPKKAFIQGSLDKEVRLSFSQRIKGTLPPQYQNLISAAKENETPEFKFDDESTPYSSEGREIAQLLRKKAPEDQIQPLIDLIHAQAVDQGVDDPLVASTDAYVTSVCFVGSKSLSHILSCIERCKERLLAIGPKSEAARRQIIESVMDYWKDQPGIGVNIVDKLLNYTILTPMSVVQWALGENSKGGTSLSQAHAYEMVASTVFKVTNRVRQIVAAKKVLGLPEDQQALVLETFNREQQAMNDLFHVMEDTLVGWAQGRNDVPAHSDKDKQLVSQWADRWLKVFRRKLAVEQNYLSAV